MTPNAGWNRARLAAALAVALFACGAAPPEAKLELSPPPFTRDRMVPLFDLSGARAPVVVWGTRDPASEPLLRERARAIARRIAGGDSGAARADRELRAADLAGRPVLLLGGPAANDWTRRLAPALPVRFEPGRFVWQGTSYANPGDAITLVYPNPLDPRQFLIVLAANSTGALSRRGGLSLGRGDWRITRDDELLRAGSFAQDERRPWSYDPALDRDLEAERARFAQSLRSTGSRALKIHASADVAGAASIRSAAEALLARLDRSGLRSARPCSLTLYRSLEEKGVIARNTRPEHLDEANRAHGALPFGRTQLDLWSVAAERLLALGGRRESPYLRPAATWLSGRFEGETLERAVSRLYFGRLLPTVSHAAQRPTRWRSPLQWIPARALLVRAIAECSARGAPGALRALLAANPPGTLDSLCRSARADPAAVSRRYFALADSLARAGRNAPGLTPRAWRASDGFVRGVCLAHSVGLETGYLSRSCGRELERLRSMGCGWISLTPFGYVPGDGTPDLFVSSEGGPDEESDESLCEAGARARALGLRVWLKPHLWSRGWAGELAFARADWPRFFDAYRDFTIHYALLAEREGMDGFAVGHELVSCTRALPERWRGLIGEVRRVYRGTLTYGANWDEEVSEVPFWDALDVVSVSFYYPLASKPGASGAELLAGARRALAKLREVSKRTGKPVLLAELGYADHAMAAVRPWEEDRAARDSETQRACYEAAVSALDSEVWVAGVFFWKWFSSDERGARDGSFSPRGHPAEQVMRAALSGWQGRPVRLP
jgi:hypothetical protein